MALNRKGMTMIELVIYIALAAVVAIVSGSLFVLAKRSTENTNANYFLNADAETAVSWLRRDLQQSCLATIQNYPHTLSSQAPGISFCSALQPDDVKRLDVGDNGNPKWRNHVYYTLQPVRDKVGKLVRWSQPTAANSLTVPTLAPLLPSAIVSSSSRTIHNRVIMPNQELYGVGNPDGKIDEHGGFRLQFVRRTEPRLSDENPAIVSARPGSSDFRGNTRLVQVELKFFTSTSSGKPSFYSLRFRVCPLY
jgi:type II secretory pathway pseudopilin PulG